MSYQKALVILKPGIRQRKIVGSLITRIERKNLDILAFKLLKPKKTLIEKLYLEHKAESFYEQLIRYMTSGTIFASVIGGENSIAVCRGLCGTTNPLNALPGSIRGDFGLSIPENVIHASDSEKNAKREIAIFFTTSEIYQNTL